MAKKNKKKNVEQEDVKDNGEVKVEVVEKEEAGVEEGTEVEVKVEGDDEGDGLALLQKENERLQKELEESKGQYLRLMAYMFEVGGLDLYRLTLRKIDNPKDIKGL